MMSFLICSTSIGREKKPSCSKVLESCITAVEDCKTHSNAQKKLILAQEDKIVVLEDRVKEVQKDLDKQTKISIGSILLGLLFLL